MLRGSSSSVLWSIRESLRGQGALYAACRQYAAIASEPGAFRFAASAYQGRSLAQGAQYLAQTVRETLGPQRPPHLLTLFITPEAEWGSSITEVPQCIRRLLSYEGAPPPLLIGGVLRKVEAYDDVEAQAPAEAAGGQWPAAGAGPGSGGGGPRMVLLAAHMPGVRLAGFHTSTPSLPALPGVSWGHVMQVAAGARGSGAPAPPPPQTPPAPPPSGPPPAASAPASSMELSGAGLRGEGAAAADQHTGRGPSAAAGSSGCYGIAEPSGYVEGSDAMGNRVQGASTAADLPGGGGRPAREDGAGAAARPESAACLLLSTPHFIELEELLRRFALTVPQMQVVGGVTFPDAWGDTDHSHGAAFLDDATHAQGVVGCVMTGPFQLDVLLTPGFRGAGPVMRVTGSAGHVVTELDGQPVQQPLQRAMSEALNSGEFATSMKIGVGEAGAAEGSGGSAPGSDVGWRPEARPQLVTRNWFFQQGPPRPLLKVFTSGPIAAGTPLQVHLQNYPAAHRDMRDRLRSYAAALPPATAATHGSVGALALSCGGLPFAEAPDVQRCLPCAAFAGGRVEGEVGSTAAGQGARLHSFSSLLAFIRSSEPGQN